MKSGAVRKISARATMAALMLAVFTVSVGYGVLLPLLPYMIERLLGADVQLAQVTRHTGLLTAVYTLSLFLFAPLWGLLSDRRGARGVLLVGLLGFGATMLVFSFIEGLAALYAERFLSGMFAAAVTPVAAAVIANITPIEQGRARRLAFLSIAGGAGFLLGPLLGVFVARLAAAVFTLARISSCAWRRDSPPSPSRPDRSRCRLGRPDCSPFSQPARSASPCAGA